MTTSSLAVCASGTYQHFFVNFVKFWLKIYFLFSIFFQFALKHFPALSFSHTITALENQIGLPVYGYLMAQFRFGTSLLGETLMSFAEQASFDRYFEQIFFVFNHFQHTCTTPWLGSIIFYQEDPIPGVWAYSRYGIPEMGLGL